MKYEIKKCLLGCITMLADAGFITQEKGVELLEGVGNNNETAWEEVTSLLNQCADSIRKEHQNE